MSRPETLCPDRTEMADALRDAQADGARVRPVGHGTRRWLHPEAVPDRAISTAALDQVRWIDPDDRTCCVEAGVRLDALDAALAQHGLMLGLDDGGDGRGSIGGALLGGAPSLCAAACGLPRDQVLGGTWLLADGSEVRTGARVVKSVAGYDVTRLFVGSRGRLALCLDLTLRLRPRPATWALTRTAIWPANPLTDPPADPEAGRKADPRAWLAVSCGTERITVWADPRAAPADAVALDGAELRAGPRAQIAAVLVRQQRWTSAPRPVADDDVLHRPDTCIIDPRSAILVDRAARQIAWPMPSDAGDDAAAWPPPPSPWLERIQAAVAPGATPFV